MKWWQSLGLAALVGGLSFAVGYVPNHARPTAPPQPVERGECRDWAINTFFYENKGCPDARQHLEISGGYIKCLCRGAAK